MIANKQALRQFSDEKTAIRLKIAILEVEYMRIFKLNPHLDMESFNYLPPIQELFKEMERLDSLAIKNQNCNRKPKMMKKMLLMQNSNK